METINDNLLNAKGRIVHGHEYHFSKITEVPKDAKFAFKMCIGKGIDGTHEAWLQDNVMALHGHLNFGFSREFAENLVKHCGQYQRK